MATQTAPQGARIEDELDEDERLELERSEKIEDLQRALKQLNFANRSHLPKIRAQTKELEAKISELKSSLGLSDAEYLELHREQQLEEAKACLSIGERTNNLEMVARAQKILEELEGGEKSQEPEKDISSGDAVQAVLDLEDGSFTEISSTAEDESEEDASETSDNPTDETDDGDKTIDITDLLEGDQSNVQTGNMSQFADQQQEPQPTEDTMLKELEDIKTLAAEVAKKRQATKKELADAEDCLQSLTSTIEELERQLAQLKVEKVAATERQQSAAKKDLDMVRAVGQIKESLSQILK